MSYYAIAIEDSKDTYYDIPLVKKGEKQHNLSAEDLDYFKETGEARFYVPFNMHTETVSVKAKVFKTIKSESEIKPDYKDRGFKKPTIQMNDIISDKSIYKDLIFDLNI